MNRPLSKGFLPAQRRSFLKAAGVSIALPILESVARAAIPAAPKRMVFISSALGMNPEAFFPTSFEKDYALSPTLKSLAPLRNDFTVISHNDESLAAKFGLDAIRIRLAGIRVPSLHSEE